ncbi:MAG: CobW family GTP-binding protein [Actinomycetes bacterium]
MVTSLTILGGYLGAGKTTLLNGLLNHAPAGRIAVVVNDFGSVNIDRRLIRSETADTIELTNGCICCNIQDDTASVMSSLADRDLDHVVVEVSGVGDPAAMARWAHFPGYCYGATVVCVDSTSAGRLLEDEFVGDTVSRQMAAADLLVLTKTDLSSTAQLADSLRCGLETASTTQVLFSAGGDITLASLLGSGGKPSGAPRRPAGGPHREHPPGHGDLHRQLTVSMNAPVERGSLFRILESLPRSVVRAKGILRLQQSPRDKTVVQYAAGRLSINGAGVWKEHEPSQMVFIAAGEGASDDLVCIRESFDTLPGADVA